VTGPWQRPYANTYTRHTLNKTPTIRHLQRRLVLGNTGVHTHTPHTEQTNTHTYTLHTEQNQPRADTVRDDSCLATPMYTRTHSPRTGKPPHKQILLEMTGSWQCPCMCTHIHTTHGTKPPQLNTFTGDWFFATSLYANTHTRHALNKPLISKHL